MKKIVLIGAGGHCLSCIEVIESSNDWDLVGLIDLCEKVGMSLLDVPVIGTDEDLLQIRKTVDFAMVAIGHMGSAGIRTKLYEKALRLGFSMPVITAPTAAVSRRSIISSGTIVMHHAAINANALIGENCIINTGSIVEHSASIGSNCHISTGAVVNGDCTIGEGCFIGSGSVIKNGIVIAPGCLIGAGAVVISDITKDGVYVGCPARRKET